MEQFKICEKDTKTKAYSKEGLAREVRTDPKEIEREEKRCWLNDCLERLGDLIDSIEVDVEKFTSVKGGKTKMKDQVRERGRNSTYKLCRVRIRLNICPPLFIPLLMVLVAVGKA